MRWNKTEYSDIEDIRIPPARLWKPDILMYNRSGVTKYIPADQILICFYTVSIFHTHHMAYMEQLALLVIGWWLVVVLHLLHLLHDPPSKIKSCLFGSYK